VLTVSGKFALDPKFNPPPLKVIRRVDDEAYVDVGPGIKLRLGHHAVPLDQLLDMRVEVDATLFTGLASVEGGCAIFCASNHCRDWARRNGRPRFVAKVIGVASELPVYVVLSQPRLRDAPRVRHESGAQRREAGLVQFVLVEPVQLECPQCAGRGTVSA
jgi:hypothetical protein